MAWSTRKQVADVDCDSDARIEPDAKRKKPNITKGQMLEPRQQNTVEVGEEDVPVDEEYDLHKQCCLINP